MFSATFAGRIITLAERMMNDPQRIAIETGHSTNTDITQTYTGLMALSTRKNY
jgi:superfamily II DNA/RNA helicase